MIERWLPVVGFEGTYEVSDLGRVRSLDRVVRQRHHYGAMMDRHLRGRLMAQTPDTDGYLGVGLHAGGESLQAKVHRLVLAAFVGPKPEGMQGCHKNGRPSDNRLVNLRYGTPLENTADSFRHGTFRHSERHRKAKLNRYDVAIIRAARGKVTQVALAVEFNIPQSNVSSIQLRKTWKHV